MPRLPVRQKASTSSPAGSLQRRARLQARAPEVELPLSFWDADLDEDDPAEIPSPDAAFVSEASHCAALFDPSDYLEEPRSVLEW